MGPHIWAHNQHAQATGSQVHATRGKSQAIFMWGHLHMAAVNMCASLHRPGVKVSVCCYAFSFPHEGLSHRRGTRGGELSLGQTISANARGMHVT
eukprot:15432678-Alexandrium_andersonii.AAC.1